MNKLRRYLFVSLSAGFVLFAMSLFQPLRADTCRDVRNKMLAQPLAYKDWAEQLSATADETRSVNELASALAEDYCRSPSVNSKELPSYRALMKRLSEIIQKHQSKRRGLIDQLMDSAP